MEARMPELPPRYLRFGPFRLDRQARELLGGDGSLVALTGKAFDTLCCLIDRRDRVVGKEELLAEVWSGRVVEENNLTQAISALRRGLGSENRYIVTSPGRGYRFIADVVEGDGGAPEVLGPPPAAHSRWRPTIVLATIALLCSLGVALAIAMRSREAVQPLSNTAAPTLAVLPFRSLSPGPRDELLELGMAETLISRISGSSGVRVRSLASSKRLVDAGKDPLEIGRQLGAAFVVEGTTQRRGERVRVNARLLAASDGSALWSGTFDEHVGRVFTLQDGIAAAVSSALAVRLRVPFARNRSPCDGTNAEAYRAYLGGRYQLDRPSAARMRQALTLFRRALDLDPSCARAYAGMAFAYRAAAMTGDQDPRKNFPLASAAVERALEINPDLAEAHASRGFIRFWHEWDWVKAEASLQRAIQLNPSSAEARIAYAHLLSNLGRGEEASHQARQALTLDPLSPMVNTLSASFLGHAGHQVEGQQVLQRALDLEPDFWIALLSRATMRTNAGDHEGAIADLLKASERCGACTQAVAPLGFAYAMTGDRERAKQLLHEMERRATTGYVPATSLATVRTALGDSEGALDLLERAYRERDIRLTFLLVDSRWDGLRSHPRFQALARRMKLAGKASPPS